MEQVAMVKGLDIFREHFKDFQDSYVLIGGVACYLAMEEAGVAFRATKDLELCCARKPSMPRLSPTSGSL
jgi:hypothetical protein